MSKTAVTYVPHTDLAGLLNPVPGRRVPMRDFDEEFVDPADYIIRITRRIWEGRELERIRDYYRNDITIHTLAGPVRGAAAVVAGTRAMLQAFPDRTLTGDNVVWCGDDARGFYSSHRITSQMTNLGAGEFGAATGLRATVCTIADCALLQNRITEEWLVRDNLALAVQLGLDPHELARANAAQTPPELRAWWHAQTEEVRAQGWSAAATPSPPSPSSRALNLPDAGEQPDAFAAAVLRGLWLGDCAAWVENAYAAHCRVTAPSGRALFGHGETVASMQSLRHALQERALRLDHVCAMPAPEQGWDFAVRWRVSGVHKGDGLYGPATGRPVLLLGVSQWRIASGKICEEWTVFDELAVLQQVYAT